MDERMRFVIRLKDGETMASLCREFGISRKTGYKIFERYVLLPMSPERTSDLMVGARGFELSTPCAQGIADNTGKSLTIKLLKINGLCWKLFGLIEFFGLDSYRIVYSMLQQKPRCCSNSSGEHSPVPSVAASDCSALDELFDVPAQLIQISVLIGI